MAPFTASHRASNATSKTSTIAPLLTALTALALLSGCGGGGSTSSNMPPAVNNPPLAAAEAAMTDAQAKASALQLWRNDDLAVHPKGSCAGCHGADFFDLARIGSTEADMLRRAQADGATLLQAQSLVQAVKAARLEHNMPATSARSFRPFQPGGSVLLPDLTDAPHVAAVKRDIAFAKNLKAVLPTLTGARISNLAMAQQAKQELLDLAQGTNLAGANPNKHTMRSLPSGIEYPRWSADVFHDAQKEGTFNDWTADIAHDPKPERKLEWQALQNAYLAAPNNQNFWKMYVSARNHNPKLSAATEMTAVPLLGPCVALVLDSQKCAGETDEFNKNKFLSALIGQHMMRLQLIPGELEKFAQGAVAFSYLDAPAYDGLKTQRVVLNMLPSPMWEIGDSARSMIEVSTDPVTKLQNTFKASLRDLGFPTFAQGSVDADRLAALERDDLMLSWFWLGSTFDLSMARISKSNATRVGEYMVGILNQRNYYHHNTLSTLLRLVTKGSLPEANVVQSGNTLVQLTPKFLMDYAYFWGYGRATLKDTNNRWNEDVKKGTLLDAALKKESTDLYGVFAGNGFRMSLYLQMEQLNKTGADALTDSAAISNPGQLQQLRDEWLVKNKGLDAMHEHFAEHHKATLVADDALLNALMTKLGLPNKVW
jgi:mono/diheme cytochrome c family protein